MIVPSPARFISPLQGVLKKKKTRPLDSAGFSQSAHLLFLQSTRAHSLPSTTCLETARAHLFTLFGPTSFSCSKTPIPRSPQSDRHPHHHVAHASPLPCSAFLHSVCHYLTDCISVIYVSVSHHYNWSSPKAGGFACFLPCCIRTV